jgi:transformation/transcription domain-associated protein
MYVCQPSSAGSSHGLKGMKEEEMWLTTGVLRSGVHCLSIFKDTEEENEMLLHFSQIFSWMENRNLTDMFATCMQYLSSTCLKMIRC